jgi:3'-5' exoribonuclease
LALCEAKLGGFSISCESFSMKRQFIGELTERDTVNEVFLVSEKQLRSNKNGNLYLKLRLSDRTGSAIAMLWNATEATAGIVDNGDYAHVQGAAQVYNGALQLILTRIDRVDAKAVMESDFVTLAESQVNEYSKALVELLRGIRDIYLRSLADCFLMDDAFMASFCAAPAGVKNHHAYKGGLLQHVVSLMELCRVVSARYPELNDDLLLMGAFLHDMGKTVELSYERELGYTDEGQLLGHVVIAIGMLEEKIAACQKLMGERFPTELALRLKHMILSHHGEYEFGSPKLPMTPEAIALHYLDNLDAKIFSISQIMREDPNKESAWTPYQPSLGRMLFKGRG